MKNFTKVTAVAAVVLALTAAGVSNARAGGWPVVAGVAGGLAVGTAVGATMASTYAAPPVYYPYAPAAYPAPYLCAVLRARSSGCGAASVLSRWPGGLSLLLPGGPLWRVWASSALFPPLVRYASVMAGRAGRAGSAGSAGSAGGAGSPLPAARRQTAPLHHSKIVSLIHPKVTI